MKYRLLALGQAAILLALIVVAMFKGAWIPEGTLNRLVQAGKLLAAVGCLSAALSFERSDYLRRAWGLQALNMFLLLRDLPLAFLPKGTLVEVLNQSIVVVANLAALGANWMMARAWRVARLEPPGSAWRRRAIIGAALALALGVAGIPLAHSMLAWLKGAPPPPRPVIYLVSGLSDTLCICLIAPVALTVLAMRGGLLVWPWGFYMGAMICWLFYDASDIARQLPAFRGLGYELELASESLRVLACGFTFWAALAQRFVVTGVQDASRRRRGLPGARV